jgi:hypothetical protein
MSKMEGNLQQQISFGDDNKKGKCENGRGSFDSLRSLRMTRIISF